MKYILIPILALFLVGCSDDVTITKKEYLELTNQIKKPEYPKVITINHEDYYIYMGSDNHEYLTSVNLESYNNQKNSFSFIHYPDCKLCLNRMKKDTIYLEIQK
jgi:hypothetical protein